MSGLGADAARLVPLRNRGGLAGEWDGDQACVAVPGYADVQNVVGIQGESLCVARQIDPVPFCETRALRGSARNQTLDATRDEGRGIETDVQDRYVDFCHLKAGSERASSWSPNSGEDQRLEDLQFIAAQNLLNAGAPLPDPDAFAITSPPDHVPDDVVDGLVARGRIPEAGVQVRQVEHAANVGETVCEEVRKEQVRCLLQGEVTSGAPIAGARLQVDRVQEGVLIDDPFAKG